MASTFPDQRPRSVMKSATAFRTISEVSAELDVPQHVLRFWETKFPQIRPLKRGGGRRYYRPEDVELLKRIQHLLYGQGYTIKGVQKLLREGRGAEAPLSDRADAANQVERPALDAAAEAAPNESGDDRRGELKAVLDELVTLRALLRGSQD